VLDAAESSAVKGVFTMDSMEINMSQAAKNAQARRSQAARAKAKGMDGAVEQLKEMIPQLSKALETFFSEEQTEPAHEDAPAAAAAPGEGEAPTDDEDEDNPATDPGAAPAAAAPGEGEAPAAGSKEALIQMLQAALQCLQGEGADEASPGEGAAPVNPNAAGGATEDEDEQEDCDEGENRNAHSGPRGTAGVGADSRSFNRPAHARPAQRPARALDEAEMRRNILADVEKRDELYAKVSKVTGAFKYKGMDSAQLAVESAKRLKITCDSGHELVAVQMFLAGRASAPAAVSATRTGATRAEDSAFGSSDVVDGYLKEVK